MSILILSENIDYHGVAVRWGLEELGEDVHWWERSLFPREQKISASVCNGGDISVQVSSSDLSSAQDRYRSIWNRRGQVPQPSLKLNKADQIVARNESKYLLTGIQSVLESINMQSLIVNSSQKSLFANAKFNQLVIAKDAGFKIPRTLISNNPGHIRNFYYSLDGRMVAKQHVPFAWRTQKGELMLMGTSRVHSKQLSSDTALQGAPVIYQELLEMQAELRVTVFGHTIFAIEQARTDTAVAGFVDIRYEPSIAARFVVPAELRDQCLRYMAKLGIVYAAFDIAVMKNGDFIFIEANEAGQFLFMEAQVPELPILDAFCQFLASGDRRFEYSQRSGLSLQDFEKTQRAAEFHQEYNHHIKVSEVTSPFELRE